jgi:hypothetical protein
MSYDLMVFDAAAAPLDHKAFLEWYATQTQWTEPHGYNDPSVPSPPLRAWFMEMITTFPPMNGPFARDDEDHTRTTDYALGRSCIYAAFAWSKADEAYKRVVELAAKHAVGFFDASANTPTMWVPDGIGGLKRSS